MTYLLQVTSPSFCAGAEVIDGKWGIVAPIIRKWTLDLTPREAVKAWRRKGWTVTWEQL